MLYRLRRWRFMNYEDMNKTLLHTGVQEFIRSYDGDLNTMAFKGSPFPEITIQELLEQIDGFRRSEKKLPTWHTTSGILFPPKLNLEQTSSETTAAYKAGLVPGETLADLTGGFGIDSYAFSKRVNRVFYFEQNETLAELATHNFGILGATGIEITAGNGLEAIENKKFDVIYLDPARRDDAKGKVFQLSDTTPDVTQHLTFLKERCTTLLIKTSPMLDLTEGLRALPGVEEIHIVAVQNEVKEVLWLIGSGKKYPTIKTVNFGQSSLQAFEFDWGQDSATAYSTPRKYLYEPNAAIMKSGGMNHLAAAFPIMKLAPHAHLFTSDMLIDFPGRAFRISEVVPYQKEKLLKFKRLKANITTRDFPLTVAQLRKKWQILEGGNTYLFFTTLNDGSKVCLVTDKME